MRIRHLTSACIILFLLWPWQNVLAGDDWPDDLEKRAIEKYISNPDAQLYRFTEDHLVEKDEILQGNVVVIHADLVVRGEIKGDILVIGGDAKIKSGAGVDGNITCINGRIYQAVSSRVSGKQIETSVKNLFPPNQWDSEWDEYRTQFWRTVDHPPIGNEYPAYSTLPLGRQSNRILLRYNRVEGLFLGLEVPKEISGKLHIFSIYGFGGYGFQQSKWQYKLGINRWLFNQTDYRFELGGDMHDYISTRDQWLISPHENSLAAFFLHDDYMDFYRLKGFQLYMSQNITVFFKAKLAYKFDEYISVEKKADWALFGGSKKFAENPAIDAGKMRSLYGELYLDTRDDPQQPKRGWYLLLSGETSTQKLGSDFSFNQYIFELRRYQRLSRFERLDIRLKAGTATGHLPVQKTFEFGGLSTLRGFNYKEFKSDNRAFGYDRMLLFNLEYNISPRILNIGLPFFNDLRYILFFDAGSAWLRADYSDEDTWSAGFSHLAWDDIKSDFGIGITSWSGRVRFSVARRTDTGKSPYRFTFRLVKPF